MDTEFKKHEVIPDVVHKGPEQLLKVEWPHSKKNAELGNELTPTDVKKFITTLINVFK